MKSNRTITGAALLSTALLLALAPAAKATTYPDLVYKVTIDLSPSAASSADAPFTLALQLVEGSGNVVNNVTASNFTLVGGTVVSAPDYVAGGVFGSLAKGVVLTNSNPTDNEFDFEFSPGTTQISFRVDQTPNSELVGTGTPINDQFNVELLDNQQNPIATTAPGGTGALLSSALFAGATDNTVQLYSTTGADAGVTVEAVPEPNSTAMLVVGALGLLGVLRLRQRLAA
jgi:hypothetical protein